jgi:diguanylate cyclase (GGDEF)-like protein/PAS domain S-box-containing protein
VSACDGGSELLANLMVIEDERIVARDLKVVLESLGYCVNAIADSGEMAIEKADELRPDLILMDIRLAGEIDGITAAQTILDRFDIPIIYLTAHSDEATLARAKFTHPLGYIVKPFEELELRPIIEMALYKHKMELQLKENAQWLSTVLNSIGDGVITTDTAGRVTLLNPVAERLTGWRCDEAMGRDSTEVFKIINELSRKIVPSPIVEAIATGKVVLLPKQTLLIRKDGIEVPIEDSVAPISQHRGTASIQDGPSKITGAVVILRDLTQQRLDASKLHRRAFYDDLTNLPNRAWFRERVTDAIARVKRQPEYLFAILLLDLDRFKVVNDSLGHLVGDQLLSSVASRLLNASRSIDTVARFGGDEFAILLENLNSEQEVFKIAQRIHQDLSVPFNLSGQEVFTNASVGIVLSSIGYEHLEELVRDADIAMYRAKASGRGCYQIFDTTMRDQVVANSYLENELRRAIERQGLTVYYQPIICLLTHEIKGFEALVRWQHPKRGMIPALDFIPLAEESGLCVLIDRWVLREACHQLKKWQERYPEISCLTISANLSVKQFLQPNLVEYVAQVLAETGLEPSHLILEITENTLIEKPELAIETLEKLKSLGIGLSLDDFGTGYSSLSYIQRFPVDSLKIDRSFISRIDVDTDSLEIVRVITLLGLTLGLDVVAEGIEKLAQLELLQQLQCEHGQGYLFAKPLSATEVETWMDVY